MTSHRRAVLVLVEGMGTADLSSDALRGLRELLSRRGAIALANVRSAGQYSAENGYASLSAVSRAVGEPNAGLALQAEELYGPDLAGVVFTRNTGRSVAPGSIVVLGLPQLVAANAKVDHPLTPGAFGGALRRAGRSIALVANADDAGGIHRLAGLVAMDPEGRIPGGYVLPDLNLADPTFPTGRRTDYSRMFTAFARLYRSHDLVVLEASDLGRVERAAEWMTPAQISHSRERAFAALDGFLGGLASALDWTDTRLYLVVPTPSIEAQSLQSPLTVAAVCGPGIRPGLLWSPTTRRAGLVTGLDMMAGVID